MKLHRCDLGGVVLVLLLDLKFKGGEIVHSLVLEDGGGLKDRLLLQLLIIVENFKDYAPSLMIFRKFNQLFVREAEDLLIKLPSRLVSIGNSLITSGCDIELLYECQEPLRIQLTGVEIFQFFHQLALIGAALLVPLQLTVYFLIAH